MLTGVDTTFGISGDGGCHSGSIYWRDSQNFKTSPEQAPDCSRQFLPLVWNFLSTRWFFLILGFIHVHICDDFATLCAHGKPFYNFQASQLDSPFTLQHQILWLVSGGCLLLSSLQYTGVFFSFSLSPSFSCSKIQVGSMKWHVCTPKTNPAWPTCSPHQARWCGSFLRCCWHPFLSVQMMQQFDGNKISNQFLFLK